MIKNIIAQGIGFDNAGDSTTIFIPTLGFNAAVTAFIYLRPIAPIMRARRRNKKRRR